MQNGVGRNTLHKPSTEIIYGRVRFDFHRNMQTQLDGRERYTKKNPQTFGWPVYSIQMCRGAFSVILIIESSTQLHFEQK